MILNISQIIFRISMIYVFQNNCYIIKYSKRSIKYTLYIVDQTIRYNILKDKIGNESDKYTE